MDMEAGDLAIEGWNGDSIRPRTWQQCRDFAVFIGGPNPALRDDQSYGEAHYKAVCDKFGDPAALDKYDTIWSLIGLHSPKGPEWANMGRSFVKAILNSSRGVDPKDNSPQAQTGRRISGFADLDGIEFLAKIDVGKDGRGDDKNEIRAAITPDHKDYQGFVTQGAAPQGQPLPPPPQAQPAAKAAWRRPSSMVA